MAGLWQPGAAAAEGTGKMDANGTAVAAAKQVRRTGARVALFGSLPRQQPATLLLTREDERNLAKRIEAGDGAARQVFIESNLRLVVSIARQYQGVGVPLSDLIQEGNIGLIQAVDHFDWRKGTRFSTCATLWIKQSIMRAMPALRHPIRIPSRLLRDMIRLENAVDHLAQEFRRQPTLSELEVQLGPHADLVHELRRLPLDAISLESSADEDGRRAVADALPDTQDSTPEAQVVEAAATMQLLTALECLTDRERFVLASRFGLSGGIEQTLGQIATQLGLSRQRVKQIEAQALRKLRLYVAKQAHASVAA